jgi:hypothetical protein
VCTRAGTLTGVKRDRVDISSGGLRLKSKGSHTALTLDGQAVHVMSAHHPSRDENTSRAMLTSAQAECVLDVCPVPADDDVIRGTTVYSSVGAPMAHVVWFKPRVGDAAHMAPEGTTSRVVEDLKLWVAAQCSDSQGTTTQQASGIYVTVGNGILPGRDRHSVVIEGESTNLPFSRANPSRSDEVEPLLATLNGIVTDCLVAAHPGMSSWVVSGTQTSTDEDSQWTRTCQYPRPPAGGQTIPSHQVAIRGHFRSEPPHASAADLHRDKMDGGFEFGGCIIFAGGNEDRREQWRRFAIFEARDGGRGVAVPVLHKDYICALCCCYREHLHGTIVDSLDTSETQAVDPNSPEDCVEGFHVVAYNLRLMEAFVRRISRAPSSTQEDVKTLLDGRLQRKASQNV